MKCRSFFSLLFSLLILFLYSGVNFAFAEGTEVDLVMFYGQGCPHCAKAEIFLDDLQERIPELNISSYEVYSDQENRELWEDMSEAFNTEIMGVPTFFVDEKVITGFSDRIGDQIEAEVNRCLEVACESPFIKLEEDGGDDILEIVGDSSPHEDPEKEELKKKLTLPVVISGALVDAINPCAFAVLIILLTTILATKDRKRALMAGIAFSLSIYISYFLIGLGLYSAIQTTGITSIIYVVVAILAIIIGLFNLKDYFWYGKWFVMEVPMSWRPRLKALLKGITSVPGAFLIGFAVSLFLLPCTSGPYIVILGLLASATERTYGVLMLLLYNFIFILPMLFITAAVYFGFTTTEKAEEWRQKKLKSLHLIAGFLLLLIGIGLLIALKLGYI